MPLDKNKEIKRTVDEGLDPVAEKRRQQQERKTKKKKWQNTDFDDRQIRTLWKAFEDQPEPNQFVFKLLLILGQRSGETRLMKWQDIDFENQIWTIPAADVVNARDNGQSAMLTTRSVRSREAYQKL